MKKGTRNKKENKKKTKQNKRKTKELKEIKTVSQIFFSPSIKQFQTLSFYFYSFSQHQLSLTVHIYQNQIVFISFCYVGRKSYCLVLEIFILKKIFIKFFKATPKLLISSSISVSYRNLIYYSM